MNLDNVKKMMCFINMLGVHPYSWGSCAGRSNYTTIPVGIDGKISTQEMSEKVEVCEDYPRYKVSSKSLDVGAGNYLNLRLLHLNDSAVAVKDTWLPHQYPTIPLPAPIEDGPPVYSCTFMNFQQYCISGFYNYGENGAVNWADPRSHNSPAEDHAQALELLKGLNNCTLTFTLREYDEKVSLYDQTRKFKELLLDPLGWEERVIWRSPLFNNRSHSHPADCLQFIAIQLKD